MFTKEEIREKIELGESSFVQFKAKINDADSLEAGLVAFRQRRRRFAVNRYF
jgi:hypothetical protein